MKRRYKIAGGLLILLTILIGSEALYVSHDGGCRTPPALAANAPRMKAIARYCYGGPEVLKYADVQRPVIAADQVLVKVHSASVNPLDFHVMRGLPYLLRMQAGAGAPKDPRMGTDFSGTIEAVGKDVNRFKIGQEVFGGADGAFGEYVVVAQNKAIALKPADIPFEQFAALPIAAVTALQAVRDKGKIQRGQKVLVNGASGGVGMFAVQLAKFYGADVTGVSSTRNLALVRSIGADSVIDYTHEDFTQSARKYDLIIDTVGNHTLSQLRAVLTARGVAVIVGGPNTGKWIGALDAVAKAAVYSPFVSQNFSFMLAHLNQDDLAFLGGLVQSGKLLAVVDRHYPLAEVGAAIAYVEAGHARGKVIIDVSP